MWHPILVCMVASHFERKLAEKYKIIVELRKYNKTQSKQTLRAREISELRSDVQSQRKQIEKLEANLKSYSGALEEMDVCCW